MGKSVPLTGDVTFKVISVIVLSIAVRKVSEIQHR